MATLTADAKGKIEQQFKENIIFETNDTVLVNLTTDEAQKFKHHSRLKEFTPHFFQQKYPHSDIRQKGDSLVWNRDFYGTLVIPEIDDSIGGQILNTLEKTKKMKLSMKLCIS